mmetsp:Transcript_55786/g.169800  ORF Transcript_55786/g.169800 Transcript_55786/m.169800 type:complete len:83 (+) Transcript_55786:132-380(+)
MTSARFTVASRCAIVNVVGRPSPGCISESSAPCTSTSLSASSADVASSIKSTRGRKNNARAMATRCFWPPLSFTPRSPASDP